MYAPKKYVYFHVEIIPPYLRVSLPYDDGFNKIKILMLKVHTTVFVNANEIWINGDWLYTSVNGVFSDGTKAIQRSPPGNITQWVITQSKVFTRKNIEKVRNSVRKYVYFVLNSVVQTRWSIRGNSASTVDSQQIFKSTFDPLINKDYCIGVGVEAYQRVLEYAISKVYIFLKGTDIYLLPGNLNWNIGKTAVYKNEILRSNTNIKIASNKKIKIKNQAYHQLFSQSQSPAVQVEVHVVSKMHSMKSTKKPKKDTETKGYQKILAESHNEVGLTMLQLIASSSGWAAWTAEPNVIIK